MLEYFLNISCCSQIYDPEVFGTVVSQLYSSVLSQSSFY